MRPQPLVTGFLFNHTQLQQHMYRKAKPCEVHVYPQALNPTASNFEVSGFLLKVVESWDLKLILA